MISAIIRNISAKSKIELKSTGSSILCFSPESYEMLYWQVFWLS
ncbi:MAG: hypothetical protein ACP5PS_01630 [Bacteroidales bacterium]